MGIPDYPADLGSDLSSLRAQIRAATILAKSSAAKTKLYAQTLELLGRLLIKAGGKLEVQNSAGNGLVRMGQILLNDGSYVDGLAVFRPGGEVAFAVFQSGDMFPPIVYDKAGNRVVYPDEVAGQGLARPQLTHSLYPTPYNNLLPTTSATFETLWSGGYFRQQSALQVYGRTTTDAATTAELRVLANGVQVGSTLVIPANVNTTWDTSIVPVPGNYLDYISVEVQMRRTAGAGFVKCAPIFMLTRAA